MKEFALKEISLVLRLILALLWIIFFPIWAQWISESPLKSKKITFSPPSTIEENVEIRLPEKFAIEFMFDRNSIEFEKLKKYIGAMGLCKTSEECSKGIVVPIRWKLLDKKSGIVSAQGEVETQDSSGWSGAHVYRHIGTFQVNPGEYTFKAEILRDIPELSFLSANIAISIPAKRSTTWQIGLVWWGNIGIVFVAYPMLAYTLCLLLWRYFRADKK